MVIHIYQPVGYVCGLAVQFITFTARLAKNSVVCIRFSSEAGFGIKDASLIPLYRDVAQFGRALGLGPRCRRFESCHPDHRGYNRRARFPSSKCLTVGWQPHSAKYLIHMVTVPRAKSKKNVERNSR